MDKLKIEIGHNNYGYYIIIKWGKLECRTDASIARLMGVSEKYYCNLLKDKFKNKITIDESKTLVYINGKDNALEIVKWLQENIMSYILLKELNPDIIIE